MSAEIADELRARLRDEWLRKATSSFTCQECGIQANFIDEILDALDAKDKRIAELEAALSEIAAGPHLLSCDKAKWADWAADRAASSLPNKEDRNG